MTIIATFLNSFVSFNFWWRGWSFQVCDTLSLLRRQSSNLIWGLSCTRQKITKNQQEIPANTPTCENRFTFYLNHQSKETVLYSSVQVACISLRIEYLIFPFSRPLVFLFSHTHTHTHTPSRTNTKARDSTRGGVFWWRPDTRKTVF